MSVTVDPRPVARRSAQSQRPVPGSGGVLVGRCVHPAKRDPSTEVGRADLDRLIANGCTPER
jgi:hypothetical protein